MSKEDFNNKFYHLFIVLSEGDHRIHELNPTSSVTHIATQAWLTSGDEAARDATTEGRLLNFERRQGAQISRRLDNLEVQAHPRNPTRMTQTYLCGSAQACLAKFAPQSNSHTALTLLPSNRYSIFAHLPPGP